ncbi:hypothetical protein CLOM_g13580 [Closterium sp. NIES-68]|nr:hypothetical protein CLOM_g1022 [Closterium sp. NIES-68]GJP54498.1 hypothetical protein CLOM_g13580 [Closterium sp. NIES-68]GJP82840.1 hypothetical protein CLOP_g13066 [Closterium sp. NIES-67]
MASTLRVTTCPLSSSAFVTRNDLRSHATVAGAMGRGRTPAAVVPAFTKQPRAQAADKAKKGRVDTLFDGSFEYTSWYVVFNELTALGLRSVSPEEAAAMAYGTTEAGEGSAASGRAEGGLAVLLDVREAGDYEAVHARGAVSAPLFRLIQGDGLTAWARRAGYAAMGDFRGTERNPDLLAQALAAVGGDRTRRVIVMCGRGGTLQNVSMRKGMEFRDPDKRFGIQSRSLKACYELHVAGFTNLLHVDGGLNLWLHKQLPSEP